MCGADTVHHVDRLGIGQLQYVVHAGSVAPEALGWSGAISAAS
ncbi:Uncharacterised protein [Mycobacteroides abscessus subsp. abscessus]|nr:Uncharacterised protein [Mycobacteroides abscessus subsp. abscessus]